LGRDGLVRRGSGWDFEGVGEGLRGGGGGVDSWRAVASAPSRTSQYPFALHQPSLSRVNTPQPDLVHAPLSMLFSYHNTLRS